MMSFQQVVRSEYCQPTDRGLNDTTHETMETYLGLKMKKAIGIYIPVLARQTKL